MKKYQLSLLLFFVLLLPSFLIGQDATTEGVDTTSTGYKIGYEIGSWLPFLVLITLVLMVMYRARKYSKD